MTIQTVPLTPGLVLALREGFKPLTNGANEFIVTDEKAPGGAGQMIYVAEAVIPGKIESAFRVGEDSHDNVRLRVVGHNPGHESNTIVRLEGSPRIVAYYQPRQAGRQAQSDVTVTAERVELAAPGQLPVTYGGLPVAFPFEVRYWGAKPLPPTPTGEVNYQLQCTLPKEASYIYEGTFEVRCKQRPLDTLIGKAVVFNDLRGFYTAPDRGEASGRSKAAWHFTTLGISEAPGVGVLANGSGRKRNEPQPEQAPPSEG